MPCWTPSPARRSEPSRPAMCSTRAGMPPRSRWGWCWAAKRVSRRPCSASAACCGASGIARRGSTRWWSRRRRRSRPRGGVVERVLTKPQRVYHWDRRGSSISSDRLPAADLPHLERGLAVYRASPGKRLGRVREAARAALESVRPDRVEAIVHLLDDTATYEWPRGLRAPERRVRVFELAGGRHPVLDRADVGAVVAQVFGEAPSQPDELVGLLYA